MREFEVRFRELAADGALTTSFDWMLRITATLRIDVRGQAWFHQPLFPVVELACAISSWNKNGGDLTFDTMESDESPFINLRFVGDRCLPTAAWQLFQIQDSVAGGEVRAALLGFVDEVVRLARDRFGVQVESLPQFRKDDAGSFS